jgi:putative oxidoreductase
MNSSTQFPHRAQGRVQALALDQVQPFDQLAIRFFSLRSALGALVQTSGGAPQTLARLALGLVMFPHGAQKMLGLFGGYGFTGTMGAFTGMMHIPAPLAFLAIAAEFFGSIALLLGVFARPAALAIAVNMMVATFTVHLPNGFFMNWYGKQHGEGFEYHILAVALAAVVVLAGAGRLSVDRFLARKLDGRS